MSHLSNPQINALNAHLRILALLYLLVFYMFVLLRKPGFALHVILILNYCIFRMSGTCIFSFIVLTRPTGVSTGIWHANMELCQC